MKRLIDATTLKAEFTGNFTDAYPPAHIKAIIDLAPTVDVVKVKHSKWVRHPMFDEWDVCIACGIGCKRREYVAGGMTEYSYQFCPNCGAKIEWGDKK